MVLSRKYCLILITHLLSSTFDAISSTYFVYVPWLPRPSLRAFRNYHFYFWWFHFFTLLFISILWNLIFTFELLPFSFLGTTLIVFWISLSVFIIYASIYIASRNMCAFLLRYLNLILPLHYRHHLDLFYAGFYFHLYMNFLFQQAFNFLSY